MAALKSLTETLENELTCSICLCAFTNPKTLQCLHSFCAKCIEEWYKKRGNRITKRFDCPLCKTRNDIPDGDPYKLRSLSYFDSLLKLLNTMKIKAADQPELSYCVSCKTSQVLIAFCSQCNGLICGKCVDAHGAIKKIRDEHRPKMLKEFRQNNVDSFILNQMKCKEKFHEKNKLEYYCSEENCKKCICQQCAILFHRNHRMQNLEEACEEVKIAIKREQELEKSQKNTDRIEKEFQEAKKEVDTVQSRGKADEHRRELDQTLQELKTANNEEQSDSKSRTKQVSDLKLYSKKLMEGNVKYEVMKRNADLHARCVKLSKALIYCKKGIHCDVTVHDAVTNDVMQSLEDIREIVKIVPSRSTLDSPKKGYSGGFVNQFEMIRKINDEGEMFSHRNRVHRCENRRCGGRGVRGGGV